MSKSRSLNKVMLIGNLTRDPVLRETTGGVMICSFGIATNTSWKDKNGEFREKAEYHNLVAFNKLAEICMQVLSQSMLVYVEGELRNKVVVDQDGKKQYRTEIKLNDMFLLDSKGKKGVGFESNSQEVRAESENQNNSDVQEEYTEEPLSELEPSNDEEELKSEDLF